MQSTVWPRRAVVVLMALGLGGCLQLDQTLPLELEEGAGAAKTLGASGGIISLPPDFSMEVPPGALSSSASITVAPRISSPFPGDAGAVLPGTAFDIGPRRSLATPATVELRVPTVLLEEGDDILLGLALLKSDGSVETSTGIYDATSGFMTASLSEFGPVAAVIELDAIDVETGLPPGLDGGTFGSAGAGLVEGVAAAASDTRRYTSSCSPSARRCFSSGLVRAWISNNLVSRLGTSLAIVAPVVSTDLEFGGFDASNQPTSAIGSVSVTGTLKARVGQSVTTYDIDEARTTGSGGSPTTTSVTITGNSLVFGTTSEGANTDLEFGLTRIATGEMLTLRLEEEVELENDDGSFTRGTVVLHVRLRR